MQIHDLDHPGWLSGEGHPYGTSCLTRTIGDVCFVFSGVRLLCLCVCAFVCAVLKHIWSQTYPVPVIQPILPSGRECCSGHPALSIALCSSRLSTPHYTSSRGINTDCWGIKRSNGGSQTAVVCHPRLSLCFSSSLSPPFLFLSPSLSPSRSPSPHSLPRDTLVSKLIKHPTSPFVALYLTRHT